MFKAFNCRAILRIYFVQSFCRCNCLIVWIWIVKVGVINCEYFVFSLDKVYIVHYNRINK